MGGTFGRAAYFGVEMISGVHGVTQKTFSSSKVKDLFGSGETLKFYSDKVYNGTTPLSAAAGLNDATQLGIGVYDDYFKE